MEWVHMGVTFLWMIRHCGSTFPSLLRWAFPYMEITLSLSPPDNNQCSWQPRARRHPGGVSCVESWSPHGVQTAKTYPVASTGVQNSFR